MSDIEKLKAYHNIESFVDEETKELLIEKLGLNKINLHRRLEGLTVEDEFALISYFSNQFKHIVSIDETTSVLTEESFQNDFILQFNDGKKIMVEVKSTEDKKFKISKNNFNKRNQFASDLGYELYFAIKFSGYWTLFHADYLIDNNYQIDFKDDMMNSIFYIIFKCNVYFIPSNIRIERVYSKNKEECLPLYHNEFGYLESFTVFYQNKKLFEVSITNIENFPLCIVLEYWYEQILHQLQVEEIEDNKLKLIDKITDELPTADFKYFFSSIEHLIHDHNIRFNSSSFLKLLTSEKDVSLTKTTLDKLMNILKELGIPIQVGKFISIDTIQYID